LRARATLLSLSRSEEGYARALAMTQAEVRDVLYSPDFRRLRGDYRAETPFVELMRRAPARSGLDRAQYADLKFYLPGDILTKTDRTSMAVSLEAANLAGSSPDRICSSPSRGLRVRGMTGKWLLKDVMRRYLPEDILFRPKMGLSRRLRRGSGDLWPTAPAPSFATACWRKRLVRHECHRRPDRCAPVSRLIRAVRFGNC
jgi:asparagine synthase (glutamine-hydrolysing)